MTGLFAMLAPYKLIIIIIAMAALFGTVGTLAYNKGYSRASDAAAARELKSVQIAVKQAQDIATQDAEISAKNIVSSEKIRIVTRTIIQGAKQHAIEKPLPVDCILDTDRLRRITDAISGKITSDPATTNGTVPSATDTGKQ